MDAVPHIQEDKYNAWKTGTCGVRGHAKTCKLGFGH